MPTIELSASFVANSANRIMYGVNLNGTSYSTTPLLSTSGVFGAYASSEIRLLTGTIPSSGLLNLANANANTLMKFVGYAGNATYPLGFQYPTTFASSGNININTNYVPATTSGTATWFSIIVQGDMANPIFQSIYGNIGAIGSGADLEMVSNAIVAGQQYRITNLVLRFPSSWTY